MEARFKVTGRWKLTNEVTSLKKRYTLFYENTFIRAKALILAKKLRSS